MKKKIEQKTIERVINSHFGKGCSIGVNGITDAIINAIRSGVLREELEGMGYYKGRKETVYGARWDEFRKKIILEIKVEDINKRWGGCVIESGIQIIIPEEE